MKLSKLEEYRFGIMEKGPKNLITDVPGVLVGHCTLADGSIQTGVTAILPHAGDIYHEKCIAASHVINGYGKSTGLVQINELGTIETPLILTNTLSAGEAFTACVQYMLERNEGIGRDEGSVNPVILECNDSILNDIRGLHVKREHVFAAIAAAAEDFKLGAVGAGRGMSCYGVKGGIGSASRVFEIAERQYTLGALVMTNFGSLSDLVISGDRIGRRLSGEENDPKGSCIMVIATDAPVSSRQLARIARRAQNGLARTGGYTSGGSGEIVVAFTTANRLNAYEPLWHPTVLNDAFMNPLLRAAVETVEEGIIRSIMEAETVIGQDGNTRVSLRELAGE
ncbi:MAG: P1 family peptidase [Clostridia bacterium]|nr:P1 family peptidase [Clostridia bacterium]